MNAAAQVERSWHLFTEGWLSGGWGVVLMAAAAGFVLLQVRREFRRDRSRTLTRWGLPLLRFAIVGLMVWLLCRPALRVCTRTVLEQELLVFIDNGKSMQVREGFGGRSRLLDVLETLQKPIDGRARFGTALGRAMENVAKRLREESDAWQARLAAIEMGQPLDAESLQSLESFGRELGLHLDVVQDVQPVALPSGEDELRARVAEVQARQQTFCATVSVLANECELVAREAGQEVALLRQLATRLAAASATARELLRTAAELQTELDRVLLQGTPEQERTKEGQRRRDFAALAGRWISNQRHRPGPTTTEHVPNLTAALARLQRRQEERPNATAIFISDGSTDGGEDADVAARRLTAMGVSIHTILAGRDGVAPADGGVVAVDVPRLVVQHEETRARVLVKWAFPTPRQGAVEILSDNRLLARREIVVVEEDYQVVDLPWVPRTAGRKQLVFRLTMPTADDYPGNEVQVRTVDVVPTPISVLLVGSAVDDDVAACQALLRRMQGVSLQVLLGVPELSRIKIGHEAGAWPETADGWRGIGLAVLVGPIPEDLRTAEAKGALENLRAALEEGLHVFVHEPNPVPAAQSWSRALGLETAEARVSGRLQPAPGLWLESYRLARDVPGSLRRWTDLGTVLAHSLVTPEALPLVRAGEKTTVGLLQRGKGRVLFCGLPRFNSLRIRVGKGVNRLLAGLLELALQPGWGEEDAEALYGVVPIQPVAGFDLCNALDGALTSAATDADAAFLQAGERAPAGWQRRRVRLGRGASAGTVPHLQVFDEDVEKNVFVHIPRDRTDYELTPRTAPLRRLAAITGGTFHEIHELAGWQGPQAGDPVLQEDTEHYSLWRGWWTLALLLVLVSAEYLLRRRAGRVM